MYILKISVFNYVLFEIIHKHVLEIINCKVFINWFSADKKIRKSTLTLLKKINEIKLNSLKFLI